MNYLKICLILIVTLELSLAIKVYSQPNLDTYTNVVPPSPTASSLGTYGRVPVGMFTGTAQYSIPVYELKSRKLTLPISLNYSSNGVRVDEVAGWVGTGWSLNAGGVITRTVKDRADEFSDRLSFEDVESVIDLDPQVLEDIIMDPDNSTIDTEPDIYAYNFNGVYGKFIIDLDGFPRQIPYNGIDIKISGIGAQRTFEITTTDGIKYYFGETPSGGFAAVETTTSQSSCADGMEGQQTYQTAWYLTRIVHPTGDEITFSYAGYYLEYYSGAYQSYTKNVQNINCSECQSLGHSDECANELRISAKRLTEINAANIRLEFASSLRTDVDDYKLDSIQVREITSGTIRRSFQLNYIYSNNTTKTNRLSGTSSSRMFLESFEEGSSSNEKQHLFTYNSINSLPVRLSYSQDHWGYYNGASNGDEFLHVKPSLISLFGSSVAANREPNGNFSSFGTLTKIQYPTGGTTEIFYQPHVYWDLSSASNIETGGVRVYKTVSKTGPFATPEIVEYHYGKLADINRTQPTLTKSSAKKPIEPTYDDFSQVALYCNAGIQVCDLYSLSSNSLHNLNGIGGSHIAYEYVVKSYGDDFENGGEYFKYIANTDQKGRVKVGGHVIAGSSYSNNGWNSGKILEHSIFKLNSSNQFVTLKKDQFTYNYQSEYGTNDVRYSDLFTAAVIKKIYTPDSYGLFPTRSYVECNASNVNQVISTYWECTTSHKHKWTASPFWQGWKCTKIFGGVANNVEKKNYHPCNGQDPNANPPVVIQFWYAIGDYRVNLYDIYTRWSYLKQKVTTLYDELGQNPQTTITDYEYGNNDVLHTELSKSTMTGSDGKQYVTKSYYPDDYDLDNVNVLDSLFDKQIVGLPIDVREEVNGNLTSGNLFQYNEDGQVTAIYQAEAELGTNLAFNDQSPYSYGSHYTSIIYNSSIGNLIEHFKTEDIKTSYLWGYNNTQPIAKVINAENGDEVIHYGQDIQDVYTEVPYSWGGGGTIPMSNIIESGITQSYSIEYSFYKDTPSDPSTFGMYFSIGSYTSSVVTIGSSESEVSGTVVISNVPAGTYNFSVNKDNETSVEGQFFYNKRIVTPTQSWDRTTQIIHENFEEYPTRISSFSAHSGEYVYQGIYNLNLQKMLEGDYLLVYWSSTNGTDWQKQESIITVGPSSTIYSIGNSSTYLDDVRLHPPDALMTTYTHSTSFGITSQTDPNGQTTYYTYDDLGRFQMVTDFEGNPLSKIDYHYSGQ